MSGLDERWARIGNGSLSVALTATSKPRLGWPSNVRVQALEISGVLAAELSDIPQFVARLRSVHETLQGTAELSSWEGEVSLKVSPIGSTGHVKVDVAVRRCEQGAVKLDYEFEVDQSHIPQFASELRAIYGEAASS